MSQQVYIVSGCRTAIGSFQGQFKYHDATDLGSIVIKETIKRANLNVEDVDQVILGQVLTAGHGQNTARQSASLAGIPFSVPAYTINMLCGSGLKSVFLAYQSIRNEDCSIIIAGGQECMTRAQHTAYIRGSKYGGIQLIDSLEHDGLTDAFNKVPMGCTAEHIAIEENITREEQDKFALKSQMKVKNAITNGYFKNEIVPVPDKRTGILIDTDEHPKLTTTLDSLQKLKPAFKPINGTVTAGNSSGINDGAATVLLANQTEIIKRNLKPLAKIIGFAETGLNPMNMGLGPIEAVNKLLNKIGWTKDDVDLFELNEAFASQSIAVLNSLELPLDKVNVNGGAIALGHPIGASGTRVLVTLLYNLERLSKKRGIASLCIGGGMGIAIAVEKC